jgi:hypothetical protein
MAKTLFFSGLVLLLTACSDGGGGSEDVLDVQDIPAEEVVEDDAPDVPDVTDVPDTTEDEPAADIEQEELPCPSFSDVQPIFTSRCTGCHPTYDQYAAITGTLSSIRSQVSSFHHIAGAERDQVLLWIDCGAPE